MKQKFNPRIAVFSILLALNSLAFAHPSEETSAANHDIGEIEFPLNDGSFNVPPVDLDSIFYPTHDYSLYFNGLDLHPNHPHFTNCWLFRRDTTDRRDYSYTNATFPVKSVEVLSVSDPRLSRYFKDWSERSESLRNVGNIIRFNLGSQSMTKGPLKENPALSHLDCFYQKLKRTPPDGWGHIRMTLEFEVPIMSVLRKLPIIFRSRPPTDNTGK